MRTVFAYPGNMDHAQQSARALFEAGALDTYVTAFAYHRDGPLAKALARCPGARARRIAGQFERRAIGEVPWPLVRTYPFWELVRSAAVKAGAGPARVDAIWDWMCQDFDARVARRHVSNTSAIMAVEYTALASFVRANTEGVARILLLPSRDSRMSEAIARREREKWPAMAPPRQDYFDARFERRYARRAAEIAAADVIIANSALTARSHIEAGADPRKMRVVPLAAPPPVPGIRYHDDSRHRPLEIVWAGNFSLNKGAPYLLEALRRLHAGASVRLQVFGRVEAGGGLYDAVPDGVIFRGSVPRPVLFDAFETSDVLVFPTLSDGFGMAVLEAMAHGLPVIATDQAGAADVITPENGFVIPAADAGALKDALQWCLDNRGRLHAMRFGALETARRRQWPDYRAGLIAALDHGLRAAGYAPNFASPPR